MKVSIWILLFSSVILVEARTVRDNGASPKSGSNAKKQPHILFIFADDMGFNDYSFNPYTDPAISQMRTPVLDSLAEDGIILSNFRTQSMCSPSRTAFLCGLEQHHHHSRHAAELRGQPSCAVCDRTIAHELHDLGYINYMVGKWHQGYPTWDCTPQNKGFDHFFGIIGGMADHYDHSYKDFLTGDYGIDMMDGFTPTNAYNGTYSTHLYYEKAKEAVERHTEEHADEPMFFHWNLQAPHAPTQAPQKYIDMFPHIEDAERRTYAGMVYAMDEAVGKLVEVFKEKGLWEDTVLIFVSDNGGKPEHNQNNWPLRGTKATAFEGGIRNIAIVHGEMLEDTGIENKQFMHISDWYPTLIALAGGDADSAVKSTDGHNMLPSIINKDVESPRKELFIEIDDWYDFHTLQWGDNYPNSPFDTRQKGALIVGDYKIITGYQKDNRRVAPPPFSHLTQNYDDEADDKNLWLYNLKYDPFETHDLSEAMPQKVMELLQRLAEYKEHSTNYTFPPQDPNANPALHGGFWVPWLDNTTPKEMTLMTKILEFFSTYLYISISYS